MAKVKAAKKKAPKRKKTAARKAAPKKRTAAKKKAAPKKVAAEKPPSRYCLGKCVTCGSPCTYNAGHAGSHYCAFDAPNA